MVSLLKFYIQIVVWYFKALLWTSFSVHACVFLGDFFYILKIEANYMTEVRISMSFAANYIQGEGVSRKDWLVFIVTFGSHGPYRWHSTEFWIFPAWHGLIPYSSQNFYLTGSFTYTDVHGTTARSQWIATEFKIGQCTTSIYGTYFKVKEIL